MDGAFTEGETRQFTSYNQLWKHRPPAVTQRVKNNFAEIVAESNKGIEHSLDVGYILGGRQEYSFGTMPITSDGLISASLSQKPHVKLLDVGTGNGRFLKFAHEKFGSALSLAGISAHNMQNPEEEWTNIEYKVGDADELADIYPQNSFDIVISNFTMMHLIDPLGAIAQMYETLDKDGVMVVDGFKLNGIDNPKVLIDHLNQNGYSIIPEYDYEIIQGKVVASGIADLMIKKTHPHLALPVSYEEKLGENERAQYKLTLPTIDVSRPLPPAMQTIVSLMKNLGLTFEEDGKYIDGLFTDKGVSLINAWVLGNGLYLLRSNFKKRVRDFHRNRNPHPNRREIRAFARIEELLEPAWREWETVFRNPVRTKTEIREKIGLPIT